jgi:hypothetical protein
MLGKVHKSHSSSLCSFIYPSWSKYSPLHLVLKQPHSMFLPQYQRSSFTHTQN